MIKESCLEQEYVHKRLAESITEGDIEEVKELNKEQND